MSSMILGRLILVGPPPLIFTVTPSPLTSTARLVSLWQGQTGFGVGAGESLPLGSHPEYAFLLSSKPRPDLLADLRMKEKLLCTLET